MMLQPTDPHWPGLHSLFIDFRGKEGARGGEEGGGEGRGGESRERKKHQFVVPLISAYIGCYLICAPTGAVKLTTGAYRDAALTN